MHAPHYTHSDSMAHHANDENYITD